MRRVRKPTPAAQQLWHACTDLKSVGQPLERGLESVPLAGRRVLPEALGGVLEYLGDTDLRLNGQFIVARRRASWLRRPSETSGAFASLTPLASEASK